MRILVCLKPVTGGTPRVRPSEDGTRLLHEGGVVAVNEGDDYALEAALALKRSHGATVTAVSLGPLRAQDILYTALAKGADAAVRVDLDTPDALVTARVLAATARRLGFELLLTGVESTDRMTGAVGPYLAGLLDVPFAGAVRAIEAGNGERVRVLKELGEGATVTLDIPLPALLSVQTGIHSLSYPALRRLLQLRRTPIPVWRPEQLGLGAEQLVGCLEYTAVEPIGQGRQAVLFQGSPQEVARILVDRIVEVLP